MSHIPIEANGKSIAPLRLRRAKARADLKPLISPLNGEIVQIYEVQSGAPTLVQDTGTLRHPNTHHKLPRNLCPSIPAPSPLGSTQLTLSPAKISTSLPYHPPNSSEPQSFDNHLLVRSFRSIPVPKRPSPHPPDHPSLASLHVAPTKRPRAWYRRQQLRDSKRPCSINSANSRKVSVSLSGRYTLSLDRRCSLKKRKLALDEKSTERKAKKLKDPTSGNTFSLSSHLEGLFQPSPSRIQRSLEIVPQQSPEQP